VGHLVSPPPPALGIDDEAPADALDLVALLVGHAGQQLADGLAQVVAPAEGVDGAAPREEEQGLGLAGREAGQIGAVAGHQAHPAVAAPLGVHGHPRTGQGLDVAVDGAGGHFEPLGQVGGGQLPVPLEEQEDREQAVGSHRPIFLQKT
jgi:hypothetical protein